MEVAPKDNRSVRETPGHLQQNSTSPWQGLQMARCTSTRRFNDDGSGNGGLQGRVPRKVALSHQNNLHSRANEKWSLSLTHLDRNLAENAG